MCQYFEIPMRNGIVTRGQKQWGIIITALHNKGQEETTLLNSKRNCSCGSCVCRWKESANSQLEGREPRKKISPSIPCKCRLLWNLSGNWRLRDIMNAGHGIGRCGEWVWKGHWENLVEVPLSPGQPLSERPMSPSLILPGSGVSLQGKACTLCGQLSGPWGWYFFLCKGSQITKSMEKYVIPRECLHKYVSNSLSNLAQFPQRSSSFPQQMVWLYTTWCRDGHFC